MDKFHRQTLLSRAKSIYERHQFEYLTVSKRIENSPPEGYNRGDTCIHILRSLFGVDWEERVRIIYVGDSEADELAISRLKGVAFTFRVTNEDSAAITKTSADYWIAGRILGPGLSDQGFLHSRKKPSDYSVQDYMHFLNESNPHFQLSASMSTLVSKLTLSPYVIPSLSLLQLPLEKLVNSCLLVSGPDGVSKLLKFLERKLLGRSPRSYSRTSSVISTPDR